MELIEKFRKSPTIFNYEEVLNILFPKANSCRLCKSPIFYENDTNVRIKRSGKIEITGKSSYTKKKHGHSLSCCEKCLAKKFPSWKNINKSKVFNTLNEITIWAFDIPDKDLILYKTGVSESGLEKKIRKD